MSTIHALVYSDPESGEASTIVAVSTDPQKLRITAEQAVKGASRKYSICWDDEAGHTPNGKPFARGNIVDDEDQPLSDWYELVVVDIV